MITLRSLKTHSDKLVVAFLLLLSLGALIHFFPNRQTIMYADTMSRLDIARKVVDNLNPGLPQLGTVWLPLPQLAMVPFIWVDFFWHSGLAGTFMSTISFIVGGYFLFKSAYILSKSFVASFASMCIFALNINVLYLQTTAMSETIFLCFIAGVVYFFLQWVNSNQRRYLVYAGVMVSGLTLIRYEGLALLASSILFVALYTIVKHRSYKRLEGNMIVYCSIACLGFGLWTLYLALIFHDPLFWLRYYGFSPSLGSATAGAAVAVHSQAKPFLAAVWEYVTSVTWMSGVIPVVFAAVGMLVAIITSVRTKTWNLFVLLLPLSVFFVMVLTLQRNTPIVQPDLNIRDILSTSTSTMTGFNIRYGIMLLPWVALLSVYLFQLKKPFYIPTILLVALFSIQLVNTFFPCFSALYEIPKSVYAKPDGNLVEWMKAHYDGGKIMVSASGFEDQMFQMGFPYRTFIHEGAGKYWSEALDRPARYATWIIVDFNRDSDTLAKEFAHKQYWSWDYNLVWSDANSSVLVFKIKTKPDLVIPPNGLFQAPH